MIVPLNLPKAPLQLSRAGDQTFVMCHIRKKKLVLTPEEWVRQHVIHFLIDKGVPQGLIASEMGLKYNDRIKRADIVIYGKDQTPKMIVECKAPDVQLTEAVFRQIASYNFALSVDYLFMTNGLEHIYAIIDRDNGAIQFLEEFPMELLEELEA